MESKNGGLSYGLGMEMADSGITVGWKLWLTGLWRGGSRFVGKSPPD